MYKYFNTCKTIEDVKENYRKLAFENHPDRGGNVEIMKQINAEYDDAFKKFKNIHRTAAGETYTSKEENTEPSTDFKDIINQIITFECITIELIGSWLWISGNTYKYKDNLKSLGFKWCSNKKMWSWHPEGSVKRSSKKFDIETIRSMFGSEEIKKEGLNGRILA